MFAGTCERLVAAGVPIVHGEAYVRTLHPQWAGRRFVWDPERGCRAAEAEHDADTGAASSPIRRVFETGQLVRATTVAGRSSSATLDELGVVEVIAVPLVFTSGEVHACAFGTDRGFSDDDVAAIEGVTAPLSRMAEILALRRTAISVITAYVGRDAGARVLAGKIRRGDTELIEAAIWCSDMRGFSTVSNTMTPPDVIAMLNELFDCQLPAIERHGGEVLKFMGDGLLAIFTGDRRCERALAASRDALAVAEKRNKVASLPLRFGIALHVGEVAYGNIGGEWRLDFTCIGRAVNFAARLESLTGQTGHDVLASEAFAAQLGGMTRIGEFSIKGWAEPVAAFRP